MKTVDEAIKYATEKLPLNVSISITIAKVGYVVEYEIHSIDGVTSEVMGVNPQSLIDDIIMATDEAQDHENS